MKVFRKIFGNTRIYKWLESIYNYLKRVMIFHQLFDKKDAKRLLHKHNDDYLEYIEVNPKDWEHPIKIRNNTTDKRVIEYVLYHKYHLPPDLAEIPDHPIILDLGSNIGLTIAQLKREFPNATVYGFEMDEENFEIAGFNTKQLNQVFIFNNAVWYEDTLVSYDKSDNFDAFKIADVEKYGKKSEVMAYSLNTIIKDNQIEKIDYLKMDIEGAELSIFNKGDLEWLDIVYSFNIEFHFISKKGLNQYVELLKSKGFHAWIDTKHYACILGVRI
ncbi:MAG: FkbM family methyltransferase [Taibaiella sp.]|nr:FkbM family methyltransferase [Taibaiella sp.]